MVVRLVRWREGSGNWVSGYRIRILWMGGKLDVIGFYFFLFYIKKWRFREVKWFVWDYIFSYLLRKIEK